MSNKICAGIVTYNPDIDRFIENIKSIVKQVEEVIVVDNSSNNIQHIEKIVQEVNGTIIQNKENKGIASALNTIMMYAKSMNYDWVILLDQDSVVPHNIICEYINYIHIDNVAVITPKINDINDVKNDVDLKEKKEFEYILEFITSGSMNKVQVWEELGGFNEKLFIDMVDYDFAYRVNSAGYKSIRLNNVCLKHEIGKMSKKRILCFTVSTYNHSAFRKYYITRNSLYIAKKYPEYCNLLVTYLKIVKRFLLVVYCENDKVCKIKAMLKGIFDSKKI